METTLNLVHYGANAYDSTKFTAIVNSEFGKPTGGLWASPVDSKHGWNTLRDEGMDKDFTNSFQFQYTGNVCVIQTPGDFFGLPWRETTDGRKVLDYEKLSETYDAVYVDYSIVKQSLELFEATSIDFCGWDCTTVVIFTPNKIN